VKQRTEPVTGELGFQSWLRPALPAVGRNVDYHRFREQLEATDRLLRSSHLEAMAMDFALEGWHDNASPADLDRRLRGAIKALRVSVLHAMTGRQALRKFSVALSGSEQLADFCGARTLSGIKGVSKSALKRDLNFFNAEQVRRMHQVLLEMSGEEDRAGELGLLAALDHSVCLIDCTCLETPIHYPTDWVLLRDVSRTLLKAILLIRRAGLRHRMPEAPERLAGRMNRLCVAMTHTRRRVDGKRRRKRVLREMKHLLKTVGKHARRHRELLAGKWPQTGYTEPQAAQIIARIDRMLGQLPQVIKQAHERIIGARRVADAEKIHSVYETDTLVIVRGKAGREVEFGNTLLISETMSGLISDWQLHEHRAPAEWQQVQTSIERQNKYDLSAPIIAVVGDRGTASKQGSKLLDAADIYDATCPRSPAELKERLREEPFCQLQKRRGSTEARIAILKQRLGGRLTNKGFASRERAVAWSVLSHNLWLIARLLAAARPTLRAAA